MKQATQQTRSSVPSLKELWSKVNDIEIAMLTTVARDGALQCRPMATQAIEHDEFLWFFANRDSGKVKAIQGNPQVGLTYAAGNVFVTASGRARITDNDAKARAFWSPAAQSWFDGGPEDSGLVLIVVDVDHAKWWDGMESQSLNLT